MAIKVDIMKAFDTISWDFLESILNYMHFSQRFILLVRNILHSASLSILINDTPHGFFSCSRGVRQEDPLSPLLFCLAEEALIRWLDYLINIGEITVHRKLPHHLFYADNVIIFIEATHSNGRNMTKLLENYGNLLGQKFNTSKSSVFFSPSAPSRFKQYITRCTSISAGLMPFIYLGVPIFRGAPKVVHLAPTTDLILNKFNLWRGHTLSLAGSHCLINNIIASSLVHSMMVYRWPKALLNRLKVVIRCYLWTGNVTKKGFANVSRKMCCAPLAEGGFGIRSI